MRTLACITTALAVFLTGGGVAAFEAPRAIDRPVLETAQGRRLQRLAEELSSSPKVEEAKRRGAALMRADPQAMTSAGKATFDAALEEISLSFITQAVTADDKHPELLWWMIPPHTHKGARIPGARSGLDNPDNVYQIASLDPGLRYVIKGRRIEPGPAQVSFVIYQAYLMNERNPDRPGAEEATLVEPELEPDGTYTVTIGPEPANGRRNPLRNSPDGRFLLVRQSLSNWAAQQPDMLEIRLEAPSDAPRLELDSYADRAVEVLDKAFPYWLGFQNKAVYRRAVNTLPQPQSRPGAWGLSSVGHFALQRDEALVVTVDALGAKYIAIQACDPWMVSRDYISKTGSLNKAQAEPNPDGTYTYVVSSADPGVRNWIDTDGLDAGTIFLRWQALPASAPSGASAIKSVQVVKLPLLAASLPPGTPRITPAQRADQLAQRAGDWRRRLGPEPIKVERGH